MYRAASTKGLAARKETRQQAGSPQLHSHKAELRKGLPLPARSQDPRAVPVAPPVGLLNPARQ